MQNKSLESQKVLRPLNYHVLNPGTSDGKKTRLQNLQLESNIRRVISSKRHQRPTSRGAHKPKIIVKHEWHKIIFIIKAISFKAAYL